MRYNMADRSIIDNKESDMFLKVVMTPLLLIVMSILMI